MNKLKLAILKNEAFDDHKMWVKACQNASVNYDIIDLTSANWLSLLGDREYDYYLACPSGTVSFVKQMYDERIYILERILQRNVFPSYLEISLHENKRYLSHWLQANSIAHPRTSVFYNKQEALEFIQSSKFPLVAKKNIGASGHGVRIFQSKKQSINYIERAFSSRGINAKIGPNLAMGDYLRRIKNIINNPSHLRQRIDIYKQIANDPQKGFVIFQEYIPHEYEWRVVKIADSYFGHQKIKRGDKASGTKGIDYAEPPLSLLNYVKDISEKYCFNSMAFDIFTHNQDYLINELQTIFGHVQAYICEKNGNPGRFYYSDSQWHFQEGMFNTNLSYDLRLQFVINRIKNF